MADEIRFIGVGAVKSGSSWMASLLDQHPEVSMSSRKEIAYFNGYNFNGTKNESSTYDLTYYLKFWSKSNKVKGEVSPQYLFDHESPKRIKSALPDVQILVMLRNPKQVVYSHYLYEKYFNNSIDPSISFIQALNKYPYLLKSACFTEQLQRYKEVFAEDKIHIYFLDKALEDKCSFSKQLYSAINLKNVDFQPNYDSVNESKQTKSNFVYAIIRMPSLLKQWIERTFFNRLFEKFKQSKFFIKLVKYRNNILDKNIKPLKKPQLSQEEIRYLDSYFTPEIEKLEQLVGEDLSRWKSVD